MGLTIKNKESYELGNNLTEFFSVPIEVPKNQDEYSRLKDDIYSLDIDNEDKANMINKINSLSTNLSLSKKNQILKEIEEFKDEYNI